MSDTPSPPDARRELRTFKPRERCQINGYDCEIVRQARRTTFVKIVAGELAGAVVQLDRKRAVRGV